MQGLHNYLERFSNRASFVSNIRKLTSFKMVKPFILSDSSIPNHHGFYVDHSTLDLSRFKGNPILLYMHRRGDVHGRWKDISFEGPQLLATPEFDVEDIDSNKISGKVERGFLNGASLYLNITDRTEFIQDESGKVWMKNAEVWEASIVDIPSNKNSLSVKLFADGREVGKEEAEAFLLSASKVESIKEKIKIEKPMSKIILTAAAAQVLALAAIPYGETDESISEAFVKLGAALQAEKAGHDSEKALRESLQAKIKEQESLQLTAMVDQAILDGQITADQKEDFVKLGLEPAKTIISKLPKKVTLSGKSGSQSGLTTEPKNQEEFFKLTAEQQVEFKNDHPEKYQKIWEEA